MKTLILLAAVLAGCVGPDLTSDPAVELGTGEVGFTYLADEGDEVPLVSGLQGGRHIWGAVRIVGIDWREIDMTFTIEDTDGVALTENTRVILELQQCDTSTQGCTEGMGEMVGITILVDNDDVPAISGHEVVLGVEANDADGRSAVDSKLVEPGLQFD